VKGTAGGRDEFQVSVNSKMSIGDLKKAFLKKVCGGVGSRQYRSVELRLGNVKLEPESSTVEYYGINEDSVLTVDKIDFTKEERKELRSYKKKLDALDARCEMEGRLVEKWTVDYAKWCDKKGKLPDASFENCEQVKEFYLNEEGCAFY